MIQEEKDQRAKKVSQFWNEFTSLPGNGGKEMKDFYHFCDNEHDANECFELAVEGIKKATSTSLWWFEKNKEPLPNTGDFFVITDWDGTKMAVIQIIKVNLSPFNLISKKYALIEGEGDKSLDYWKTTHKAYYTREMKPFGDTFIEDMMIVCEEFRVVYWPKARNNT